jgi:DHA1 family tetracycline resistance protein-like MFS transporter
MRLAVVMFLVYLAHYVLQTTFVLYADYRYHWGPQAVGYVLMLVGACDGFVQAVLTRRLAPRFGERRLMLGGMLCGIGSFLVMGLANTGFAFLLGIPLMALWGLSQPPIQSLMTHEVDPAEQGRLQGAISSLASFAGIFGPFLFAQVFSLSISPTSPYHLPGLAFVLSAVLLAIGTVIALRATRHTHDLATREEPLPNTIPGEPSSVVPLQATITSPETPEHSP